MSFFCFEQKQQVKALNLVAGGGGQKLAYGHCKDVPQKMVCFWLSIFVQMEFSNIILDHLPCNFQSLIILWNTSIISINRCVKFWKLLWSSFEYMSIWRQHIRPCYSWSWSHGNRYKISHRFFKPRRKYLLLPIDMVRLLVSFHYDLEK